MKAVIWEHWYRWYVDYTDENGDVIAQEQFNELEDAKADARRWGAFVIVER